MARGRKARGTPTSQAQSTLSFNNSTRVTKPGTRHDTSKKTSRLSDQDQEQLEHEVKDIETPEIDEKPATAVEVPVSAEQESQSTQVETVESESPTKPQPKNKKKTAQKDERELAAEKVTDAQIKKYWKAEEATRLAPRSTFVSCLLSTLFLCFSQSRVTDMPCI